MKRRQHRQALQEARGRAIRRREVELLGEMAEVLRTFAILEVDPATSPRDAADTVPDAAGSTHFSESCSPATS